MFGLDKLFGGSGLLGSFFDSIGMSWMNNFISLAVNISTGNWLGAAKDVFNLVSQFSNSWQNQVSQFQPLGAFSTGGCFGGDNLQLSRMSDLQESTRETNGPVFRSARTIYQSVSDRMYVVGNQESARMSGRV